MVNLERCALGSVALLGRAGPGLINSVLTGSNLRVVLVLKAVHPTASVELSAQYLVCLAEAFQLGGQVTVLTLEAGCVALEGFFLSCELVIVVTSLGGGNSKSLDVTAANV